MNDYEQEDPIPQGDLALQITALPRETNGFGDIYGGWLVSQMDLAGTAMASKVAGGRVATVAIDRMAFLVPVSVGAQLSFYTQALEIGRSSIQMMVEVWSDDPLSNEWRKVTEAVRVRRHRRQWSHSSGPAATRLTFTFTFTQRKRELQ